MGRNSKKNTGRKPATEQGLKDTTSLATTPSRPARTAKHKVRKFPPQSTTSSIQANDSPNVKSSQSLKKAQPVLSSLPADNLKHKVENQAVPSYASATNSCESPSTSTAILQEFPEAGSSSTKREVELHQPISSDSYDTSSSSSSETEMGVKNDFNNIPHSYNVADILKAEQEATPERTQRLNVWQQEGEKLTGVDTNKFTTISMVAMESKEVPLIADNIEHTPQIVAVPDVKRPFITLSTCSHDELEVDISKLLNEQAVVAQADGAKIDFKDGGAIQESNSPLQVFHLKQESLLRTETPKQASGEDSCSDPAIVKREEDSMDAETLMSEQRSSRSETTVIDATVTFCTSPGNLKHEIYQVQELELVDESFDKESEEDKDRTPTKEDPPCSIQESASTNANQQIERNAQELIIDILQHQEREMSEQSMLNVIQALEAVVLTPSLQSEGGQATIVEKQHTDIEVEQKHEPEELNRAERDTVDHEMHIANQEPQPLTENEHSTTSIHYTMHVDPAEIINEAQQNMQESAVLTSLNADIEAQERNKENSSIIQILECKEDGDVKLATQSVVPEAATTFGKHNLLDIEQNIIELEESEAYSIAINTRIKRQGEPSQAYIGSEYRVHATNSVENQVEKLEVSETEAEDLTPKEKKEYQDEQPHQLHGGIAFEGYTADTVETEVEKLEVVELEVHSIILHREECQEEEPDDTHSGFVREKEHKTTDSLKDDIEKPHVVEPQVESVTLDKNSDYQEEEFEQVYSDPLCKKHPRSLEYAIQKLDASKSEVANLVAQEKGFEEKHTQPNDIRNSGEEKKPEVVEPELETATLEEEKELQERMPDQDDGGCACKRDETTSVKIQLEKEPEVDNAERHEEKESQEDERDQLDRGTECKGHATDSVEDKMEKLQVEGPEVKDTTLNKDDNLQEQPDYTHGVSVSQEHTKTNSAENATETLEVREPWEGGAMLHKEQECQESEPDQPLDRGLVGEVKREVGKLEVGQPEVKGIALDTDDCLQEKSEHADCGSISKEDKTPDSLENVGEPQVDGDKDQECQEDKFNQKFDLGTVGKACEEHSTNFIESEIEKLEVHEPEADAITINKEECQEEKTEQVHSGSDCEENKTENSVENVEKSDPQVKDAMLDEDRGYQQENPDQVDRDSSSQVHTESSVGHKREKLEVGALEAASAIQEESKFQEEHTIKSLEDEREHSKSGEESAALEEKKESPKNDQVDTGYACDDHEMHCMENQLEQPEVREREIECVALHKEKESHEDELDELEKGRVCEGHAKASVTSEMEKVEAEKLEALDKEECEEEKHQEADVGSVCEEHPQTVLLEHAIKNPDVREPQKGVTLDKHLELQEETTDQVGSDSVCGEHPTPVENKVEKLEVEGLENAIAVEERVCQEENTKKSVEKETEQSKPPEVESAAPEENNESLEEMPDQIDRGYECKKDEMHSVKNDLEKPEVGEPVVEGGALHEEDERREDELHQPRGCEGYPKSGIESEFEAGEPEVAMNKEESEEPNHHYTDGDSLYEEQRQTDLEHAMEKPVMEEPQVKGAKLDKDQKSPEEKPNQVSSDSVTKKHPTSSTENETSQVEVEEMEKATAIDKEQPKPEVESASLEKKKESSEGMPENINSGHVHGEHEMHSVENEQVKPHVGEAEVESMALHKKKDSEEDELDQLAKSAVCDGDAKSSAENKMEKLEAEMPKLESTALTKEESEEEKHHQANDGSIYEDHQVTDFLEHALGKPDVEEPQMEGVPLEKDQELQKDLPDQVYGDSVSQDKPTSSAENEREHLEVGDSEKAITKEEDKECHEEHTIKSVDNEMEQPRPEEESDALEKKKAGPEDMPDQIDNGCERKEHPMHLVESELEKPEMEEPEVQSTPLHNKKKNQEDAPDQLERGAVCEECTKNSAESEREELEVGKPQLNTTAMDNEECKEGKHEQAEGGSECEEHQATDSLEDAMEKPDVKESQVVGVTHDKDQESPKNILDQVDGNLASQEHPTSSVGSKKEKLEMGESQKAITNEEDKKCQEEDTMNYVNNGMGQPKPEVESAALEKTKESSEQMPKVDTVAVDKDGECQEEKPEQVYSDSVCEEHIRSAENEIEKLEVDESEVAIAVDDENESEEENHDQLNSVKKTPGVEEPEVGSASLEEGKELQEKMPCHVDRGYVCTKDETTSTGVQPEKEPAVHNVAFHEEQESQEDKPDLLNRGTVCEGHATNSIESEMEVGEPDLKHITLDKEDYLQEPLNQVDATNPVESENEKLQVREPGVKDTLDTEDGGSVCEEHQVTDFQEHAIKKPDVGEPQVEGATLDQDQKSPEEKLNQVDSDSACKELPTSSLEKLQVGEREYQEEIPRQFTVCEEYDIVNVLEKPTIKEPEVQRAAIEENKECQEEKNDQVESDSGCKEHETESVEVSEVKDPDLNQVDSDFECEELPASSLEKLQVGEREYQEEIPRQFTVCEEYDIENVLEKPAIKEPEVQSAAIEENKECQEEKNDQVENDSGCKEHETESVDVSEVKDPDLNQVDSDFACKELPTSSLEKLQVGEREYQEELPRQFTVCEEQDIENMLEKPAIKEAEVQSAPIEENKDCHEEKNDQVESDSVCKEHERESVEVSEVKDPELESVAIYQIESNEDEADEVSVCVPNEQLITDSVKKNFEKPEVSETQEGLAIEEKQDCQPNHADHASCVSKKQAPESVACDSGNRELEEPKAGAVLDKVDCQEEQPSQFQRSSICEMHTTNLLENEIENPKMEEPEVDGVTLGKERQCRDKNPANVESPFQNTSSFSEREMVEKLDLQEPEVAGAANDSVDCQNKEPCQLHTEPLCEEQKMKSLENEMEKLEGGELEGSVKLDEEDEYQEGKFTDIQNVSEGNEQTTSSLESEMEKLEEEDPEITLEKHQDEKPREPKVSEQEVDSTAFEENRESQEDGSDQVNSGGYEEQATKSGKAELERKPDAEGVTLDKMQASHEDKPSQIKSSSECGQQPAFSVEHEKEKLEVEEPQYLGKEQSPKEESDQDSNGFVGEEHAADIAETEIDKLEVGNPEVADFQLDNEQWQKVKPQGVQDDSVCKQHSTRSMEDMEKLEVGHLEVQSIVLDEKPECEEKNIDHIASDFVHGEQTSDFVKNGTNESEAGVPKLEDIELGERECQSQMPDQIISSSESKEHATASGEDDMDKFQVRLPELGDDVAPEVCHEEITNKVDNGTTSEAKKPDVDVVPLEEEKECQEGKPDQIDGSRSMNEAHPLDSVQNETAKPEVMQPEVQDNVQDKKECNIEKPDQDGSNSVHEEHAADFMEDNRGKLEVNQPEVRKLDQFVAGSTSASNPLENEREKLDKRNPEVKENVLDEDCQGESLDEDEGSSICEEHATNPKEDNKDELEVNQPEVEKPDPVVASDAFVHEAHTLDSLKNETEMPEVAEPAVKDNLLDEKKCHGEKPDQDEGTFVREEHVTDSKEDDKEKLEVHQPGKHDQVAVTWTPESDAHTLDSLESEIEKIEGVPEVEDNVLEQKECPGEKPHEDESRFVCKEHATTCKETDEHELAVNQPEGGKPDQVLPNSASVSEAHTLDSMMNETEKPEEGVPEAEDKGLEQKESLDEKQDQVESGSVCDEFATDSMDKLEVNQPEVGKPDQIITSNTSTSKAHTLDSLENETEKPEDEVQEVEDNVLEQKECLGEKPDHNEKSSVHDEHATDSKDHRDKLEVKQPEVEELEQVVAHGIYESEASALGSLEQETEKPKEGTPEVEDNVLEQECHGEKPDQDESSSRCEEHAASKKNTISNVEVNQPEVREPDQDVTGSTSLSERTLNSLENGTQKPEVGAPEVEDDGLASGTFSTTQKADDYLNTKDEEQEAQPVDFPVALSQEKRDNESGLPSMARDAEQTLSHNISSEKIGQEEGLTDVPAEGESEEIDFKQPIYMSHAPKHQEGPLKILGLLDTAQPERAKQEPIQHISREEEQKLHLTDVPATLAPSKLQAQEAIPGDEERLILCSIHTTPSDVKETRLDIKQHENGAEEQHSPHSVLQKQESPAEDEINYGIQAVAATNAEQLSDKDVESQGPNQKNANEKRMKQETSAALDKQTGDFCLEEPAPIDIPHSNVMIIPIKTEPTKEDLDEAFLSLSTPEIACSHPSNLLPLPL